MNYLYHAIPRSGIQGQTLYPLNQLKNIYPETYAIHIKKYANRMHITEQRIPILNCLWNDVLHLSPVEPHKIKAALIEAGCRDFTYKCYRIDPFSLDPKKTIVFLNPGMVGPKELIESSFKMFDRQNLEQYDVIPQKTKEYYKAKISVGEDPLAFHGIVHVLYKGTIDVTNLEVVSA